ncbi:MAG: iron transporter [Janthinobacterium lividum]
MKVVAGVSRGMLCVAALGMAVAASAAETPLGKQQIQGGMEIGAVYLQPITMEPEGMMRKAADSDVHLETDIHAVKNNPTGFAEGDWMPYLQVSYVLTKPGSSFKSQGMLMAMVASDGPHYGDNVKLAGPGKYHLELHIAPPAQSGAMAFGRHVDKETGVGPWFKPFTLQYDFPYAGIGKKGGY